MRLESVKEALKLNLGSRDRRIPGFKNMDIDAHPGVDFVGDVSCLAQFSDGSVSEIYASQILEHFPQPMTLKVLQEWCRVLEPGGILYIGVPDFARACEIYQKHGMIDWVVNQLWGDQGYATAYHYTCFDEERLRGFLLKAGFSEASRVDAFPVGDRKDCSHQVFGFDQKPVSLNMVAIK